MPTESGARASESERSARRTSFLLRAPSPPVTLALVALLSGLLAFLLWWPNRSLVLEGFVIVLAIPSYLGAAATTPLARALGGRFEFHRSAFLALTALTLQVPLAVVWRGAWQVWPSSVPDLSYLAAFLVGPAFWFRHLSLYGVSRSSHARMLGVSILPPVLYLVTLFALVAPTHAVVAVSLASLVLAFVCALALLRAADRPLQREFKASGVALIRPLLDHVGQRDPEATRALEEFFHKSAVPADLKVRLVAFVRGGKVHATVALPTVHPGPFAALGASDLPRKLTEQLGPAAGTVFVPHTPSDHDLDLPSEAEVTRVGTTCRELLAAATASGRVRGSPLVEPYPGSLARAQVIGDVVLVTVSQAPAPTDDIAYSVADRIVRETTRDDGPHVVLVDAHNSYVEGEGDVVYGTPIAEKLGRDAKAALAAAEAASVAGPVEVGVATRTGYSIGADGIGPEGIRGLVVRAAGTTSGYLLIDGNNLLVGQRDPIVRALREVVDVAEVLTTDNHVVHEVDGGLNPVGERYPLSSLLRDGKAVLTAARADLAPTEVRYGEADLPGVPVIGPGLTARLLTSLGDTLSMFTNMFPATLLLLITSSLVVIYAIR